RLPGCGTPPEAVRPGTHDRADFPWAANRSRCPPEPPLGRFDPFRPPHGLLRISTRVHAPTGPERVPGPERSTVRTPARHLIMKVRTGSVAGQPRVPISLSWSV